MSNGNLRQMMSNRDIAVIILAAILIMASAAIQYFYMRSSIVSAATQSAKSDLTISCQQIETEVTGIETAVNTMGYSVLQNVTMPEAMYDISTRILKETPLIQSCVVAFSKGYYSPQKDSLYAPCVFRNNEIFNRKLYTDYLKEAWYADPATYRKPQWSEPYLTKDGSGKFLVTYSYPVTDLQGRLVAILAAEVPTDSLTKAIDGVEGYPQSYAVLTSKSGHRILGTNEDVDQDEALVFSSEVGKVGWKLTTVCPNADIDKKTLTTRIVVLAMQVLAMILLLLIVGKSLINLSRLKKTTSERDRMGDELERASDVQEAMQPTASADLPQNEQVSTYATIINAREIGGDFYDCFLADDQLSFCIGDVAGNGAPAALLMAMAKSAFRVSAQHRQSSSEIMSEVNQLICKLNDGHTTIKMLGGTLDLTTGQLRYCNAGMHSPILLGTGGNHELDVAPNDRIGISLDTPFEEQQTTLEKNTTLFLYTDGLTEAENKRKEQWGTKRLNTQLSASHRINPGVLLSQIEQAVKDYTKGTLLPDDMTMLAINYRG